MSASPATGFQSSRLAGARGFRSGSLSSGSEVGLTRRSSTREARTDLSESVVLEGEAEETLPVETGSWGKGLSRQSSLQRKGKVSHGV
jgi:hypothetical protein